MARSFCAGYIVFAWLSTPLQNCIKRQDLGLNVFYGNMSLLNLRLTHTLGDLEVDIKLIKYVRSKDF